LPAAKALREIKCRICKIFLTKVHVLFNIKTYF